MLLSLVHGGRSEPMVHRSDYQSEEYGNLWITLIGEACHAGSVIYKPSVQLAPSRIRNLSGAFLYRY